MLMREPDQFRVERAHPQLAFGTWLVKLAKPDRYIAANDNGPPAGLDDDNLHAGCVPRCRHEPKPGEQLEFTIDRHIPHAGRVDPFANGVLIRVAVGVVELPTLDADGLAGKR